MGVEHSFNMTETIHKKVFKNRLTTIPEAEILDVIKGLKVFLFAIHIFLY